MRLRRNRPVSNRHCLRRRGSGADCIGLHRWLCFSCPLHLGRVGGNPGGSRKCARSLSAGDASRWGREPPGWGPCSVHNVPTKAEQHPDRCVSVRAFRAASTGRGREGRFWEVSAQRPISLNVREIYEAAGSSVCRWRDRASLIRSHHPVVSSSRPCSLKRKTLAGWVGLKIDSRANALFEGSRIRVVGQFEFVET